MLTASYWTKRIKYKYQQSVSMYRSVKKIKSKGREGLKGDTDLETHTWVSEK